MSKKLRTKRITPRNKVAESLADARFRKRVVRDKTKYSRKGNDLRDRCLGDLYIWEDIY